MTFIDPTIQKQSMETFYAKLIRKEECLIDFQSAQVVTARVTKVNRNPTTRPPLMSILSLNLMV